MEFLFLSRLLPAIFQTLVNFVTMPSSKTPDAGVLTPKSRKVGSVKNAPNNVTPAKPTPLGKAANNVPTVPATNEKRHRQRKRKRPRNKNKRGGEAKAEGLETVVAEDKESKKKLKQERGPKALSRGDEIVEKDVVAAPRPNWKLSPSLGGRFLQLDPVFAKNEKYRTCTSFEIYMVVKC